jgi:hypothetical protein
MPSRRSVLALMASLLGLPLGLPAAFESRHEIRRYGRYYIVNGWVLTARDLKLIGLDAG